MSSVLIKHVKDVFRFVLGDEAFGFNDASLQSFAYPLDLEFTLVAEKEYYSPRDAAGLPVRQYRTAGVQYNPTRIAGFALAHYNRFVHSRVEESRDLFLRAADWFAAVEDGLWTYQFDWNDLQAPWLSCMAQGEGISVLIRAFHETGEERYLEVAHRGLAPLAVPVASGGVRSHLRTGGVFLEEYPSSAPVHVLNGFLFALNGIHDLMRIDGGIGESVEFDSLVASIEANLHLWDLGYWSAYDLAVGPSGRRNVATVAYHRLHAAQLHYLGTVLERPLLQEVAARWRARIGSPVWRIRALGGKLLYRALVPTQR